MWTVTFASIHRPSNVDNVPKDEDVQSTVESSETTLKADAVNSSLIAATISTLPISKTTPTKHVEPSPINDSSPTSVEEVVEFDIGSHDVASFFTKPTYQACLAVYITSRAMFVVTSLLDTGAGPNLVNNAFLPREWQRKVVSTPSPSLRTATRETVKVEGIVRTFVQIGDLRVRAWSGVVENLAVDILLGTSFIDRFIISILAGERKVVPYHSCSVSIILSLPTVTFLFADVSFVDHENPPGEEEEEV